MLYGFLADALLVLHVCFALFIVAGLGAIIAGRILGRPWVRNRWFRGAHLAAMGIVLLEALAGWFCPLTRWEYQLRQLAGRDPRYEGSFMHYWAEKLFYFTWPDSAFTALYTAIFLAILLCLIFVPVNWRGK